MSASMRVKSKRGKRSKKEHFAKLMFVNFENQLRNLKKSKKINN